MKYLLLCAGLFFFLSPAVYAAPDSHPVTFETSPLTIITPDKKTLTYSVEIAVSKEQRAQGLKNRDSLPEKTGMLFLFGEVIDVKFWMKDTKIPLDIIFIGKDGTVLGVHENARPFDETPIPSPEPSAAVLEIAGSTATKQGIIRGATLIHPAFNEKSKKDSK